jgi:hypothetical protein
MCLAFAAKPALQCGEASLTVKMLPSFLPLAPPASGVATKELRIAHRKGKPFRTAKGGTRRRIKQTLNKYDASGEVGGFSRFSEIFRLKPRGNLFFPFLAKALFCVSS